LYQFLIDYYSRASTRLGAILIDYYSRASMHQKETPTMIHKIIIGNGDYNSIDQLLGDSRVCSSHTHSRKMSGKK